jgi:hypothetical protein
MVKTEAGSFALGRIVHNEYIDHVARQDTIRKL